MLEVRAPLYPVNVSQPAVAKAALLPQANAACFKNARLFIMKSSLLSESLNQTGGTWQLHYSEVECKTEC